MEREFLPVSIALLTVSDTRVIENDKSGNLLANKIEQSGHILFERKIVKDEILDIQEVSKTWIKKPNVEVIISTGGTEKYLTSLNFDVLKVENLTSYPSIFGGRVKTLHPSIFGGILYRRENDTDKI